MLISHRFKYIFFSNPKTGSTTLRHLLSPHTDILSKRYSPTDFDDNPFYGHMPPVEARKYFHQFGWDFYGYIKFVFVRNPWARLVSVYEHIHRNEPRIMDFETWLYSVKPYGRGGGPENQPFRRYSTYSIEHFIKDETGNVLVDKVIRLEDINTVLIPFLISLNLPINPDEKIPRLNERPIKKAVRPKYTAYYTPATRDYVQDIYRYDIVNYGYKFDE